MRTRMLAVAAAGTGAALALGGCSLLNSAKNTAATTATSASGPAHPSAAAGSYPPGSGPVEAANQLPRDCSGILTTAQLQAAFGPGVPIGTTYGAYAALPNIGRTGRVACVFGVGLDSFGQQSTGVVEVSISTYTSASAAAGRAADTVQQDSAAGATTAQVMVLGRPATLVVEQTAAAPSAPAASPAVPPPAPGAPTAPAAGATPTATASPGETELILADGNRTFVLQIPIAKMSPSQAATALTALALTVYRNTLPTAAPTTQSSATG